MESTTTISAACPRCQGRFGIEVERHAAPDRRLVATCDHCGLQRPVRTFQKELQRRLRANEPMPSIGSMRKLAQTHRALLQLAFARLMLTVVGLALNILVLASPRFGLAVSILFLFVSAGVWLLSLVAQVRYMVSARWHVGGIILCTLAGSLAIVGILVQLLVAHPAGKRLQRAGFVVGMFGVDPSDLTRPHHMPALNEGLSPNAPEAAQGSPTESTDHRSIMTES